MKFRTLTALTIAGLLSATVSAPLVAQDMLSGDAAIDRRIELMRANGGMMRSLGGLAGDDRVEPAQALAANFAELHDLWPEDSMTGDTKALPLIWEDMEGFMAELDAATAAADTLVEIAPTASAEEWGAAVQAVGMTCGSCHGKYRAQM